MNLFLFRRKLGREKISVCLYPVYRGVKVSRKKNENQKAPRKQTCADSAMRSNHQKQEEEDPRLSWEPVLSPPWNFMEKA